MKKSCYAACGLIGLSAVCATSRAADLDRYWVGTPGFAGNLSDSAHWSATPGGAGGASVPDFDYLHFNNNQTTAYEVDLTGTIIVKRLEIEQDKVILDLNSFDLLINGWSGALPPTRLWVGNGNGLNSELTITSSTATKGKIAPTPHPLNASNIAIVIGGWGTSGPTGSTGKLTIENGASLSRTSSGGTILGNEGKSHGILDINGGLFTESGAVTTGRNADADILVRNGGKFSAGSGTDSAGLIFGSANTRTDTVITVTVDGPGSTWLGRMTYGNNTFPNTGFRNNTTILISDGGTAAALIGTTPSAQYYGFADGARGNNTTALTTVENTGSTMRSGFHSIGGNLTQAARSTHQVIARDGGILGATARLKVWEAADTGSKGTLTLDDGIVELNGQTVIGTVAAPVTYFGELSVGGILRGEGTIRRQAGTGSNLVNVEVLGTAAGTWAGATAVNGELRPGDISTLPAVGTLRIQNGNLNLTTNGTQAGTLHLDLAANGNHDQMLLEATAVNDGLVTASLLGALDYTVDGGFDLSSKTFYDLVIAQDVVHNPLNDDLATALSALGYTAGVDYTYGVVTIAAGDYDNDQYAGYEALRLTAIPEPVALGLLTLGGLLLGRRRN